MKKFKSLFLLSLLMLGLFACQQEKSKDYTQWVNTFVGTGGHGHTYPGAAVPFGMVQLSPDTRNDNSWDGCAGYHYSDSAIIGFSHTHLSGVGVPDYCDILFLPHTGSISLNAGTRKQPSLGYRSTFRHETEKAEPGFYKVTLDDYNVDVELTATTRVGIQRYTFKDDSQPKILLDLIHRDEVTSSSINVDNNTTISGYRHSKDWAGKQQLFFATEFSIPFNKVQLYENGKEITELNHSGKRLQAIFTFPKNSKEILVKTALSSVSEDGAKKNLVAEFNDWDFERVRKLAHNLWNQNLGKIEVESDNPEDLTNFYSSWYHCLLTPNVASDVDGRYRGMDNKIHKAENYTHYTVFSLWDTFRNLHPLLTITHPKETRDFVCTLIDKGEQFGTFPMWELAANDTRCMIGYHAVSLINDAYQKGITDFDKEKALKIMLLTANKDWRGLKDYREKGFVPANKSSQAVSKTLEYAYNDWCIAEFAKSLGKDDVYENFIRRSLFYNNCFDNSTGFMRGKEANGKWVPNFEPTAVGYHYTEGNAFQYSFFVPHDVYGLIALKGGKKGFENWLDALYNTEIEENLHEDSDVSGLIGNYAHGNEPSHHISWLYAWLGNYTKLSDKIRKIIKTQYRPLPNGISGNEDCGQMSAWYVMSSTGLFSVCPGNPEYVLGLPYFKKVIFHLDNGNNFEINTDGSSLSDENRYPASYTLNKNPINKSTIQHNTLLKGGTISFKTDKKAGSFSLPTNYMTKNVVENVFLKKGDVNFLKNTLVELSCPTDNADIYYTLDGSEPNTSKMKYAHPFTINKSVILKTRAYKKGLEPSYLSKIAFTKSNHSSKIDMSDIKPGLQCEYYEGIYRSIYDFALDTPAKTVVVPNFDLNIRDRDEWLAINYSGYIKIDRQGLYSFEVTMNDGGALIIDGVELFESDGRKEKAMKQHGSIWLSKGLHPINLGFFQCSDKIFLDFKWKKPGQRTQFTKVPRKYLYH